MGAKTIGLFQEFRVVFCHDSWHAVINKSAEVVSFVRAGRLLSPAKAGLAQAKARSQAALLPGLGASRRGE